MDPLIILCVDDQRDVLAALLHDLESLAPHCRAVDCETADEAKELLNELDGRGEPVPLIVCDHIMPGQTGVDLLAELRGDARFPHLRRILLTGLATHQDTIRAINQANIDRYIEKPWTKSDLLHTVRVLLTHFVLDTGRDYRDYLPVLDSETLFGELHQTT